MNRHEIRSEGKLRSVYRLYTVKKPVLASLTIIVGEAVLHKHRWLVAKNEGLEKATQRPRIT